MHLYRLLFLSLQSVASFRFFNLKAITLGYWKTYDSPEQRNTGISLNQLGIHDKEFTNLTDNHLIKRYMEYSIISYCRNTLAIQSKAHLNMRVGNFTVKDEYIIREETNDLLFVAFINHESKSIAFSFRGTRGLRDAWIDIKGWLVGSNTIKEVFESAPTNSKVHSGFWERFIKYKDQIKNLVKDLQIKYNDYLLTLTGHSLGGAWATLQAAYLAKEGFRISAIYTFGSPKLGNQIFANHLVELIGSNNYVRVWNQFDIVPQLGPYLLFGNHPMIGHMVMIRPDNTHVIHDSASVRKSNRLFWYFGLDELFRFRKFGPKPHSWMFGKHFKNSYSCSLQTKTPRYLYKTPSVSLLNFRQDKTPFNEAIAHKIDIRTLAINDTIVVMIHSGNNQCLTQQNNNDIGGFQTNEECFDHHKESLSKWRIHRINTHDFSISSHYTSEFISYKPDKKNQELLLKTNNTIGFKNVFNIKPLNENEATFKIEIPQKGVGPKGCWNFADPFIESKIKVGPLSFNLNDRKKHLIEYECSDKGKNSQFKFLYHYHI